MKWKIAVLVAIVVGAVGGSWLKNLPGFVIIAYEKTSYEMRLWIAVAILLILLTCLVLIGIFIHSLISGATRVKGWQGGRHWKKARKQTIKGMLAFAEGRWKQAEKIMITAAKNSDAKLINYLVAAQSAQLQNEEVKRDSYLRLAHESEPEATIAIGLTQAQLQLENNQLEQALATLTNLRAKQANHPFILQLLYETYLALQDWKAIIELLPAIKKNKIFGQVSIEKIQQNSVKNLLEIESKNNDIDSLQQTWKNLPAGLKKSNETTLCYASLLTKFNFHDQAEKIIKPLFKQMATAELIELYGKIESADLSKQFNFLENWSKSNSQSPGNCYLALGKIAFKLELWGKARFYLERALRVEPNAESYFIMAETLVKLDDEEHASTCYKQGLEFVVHPEKIKQPSLIEEQPGSQPTPKLIPKL